MTGKKPDAKLKPDRDDLKGEHPWGDVGQIILLVVFLAVWILDSFILHWTTWLAAYVPWYVRVGLAVVIAVLAVIILKAGHGVLLKEVRESARVVQNGILGRVRHPIYLGSLTFCLAFEVSTLSAVAMAVWLILAGFYHYIARYEERLLLEAYGQDYADYMRRVPMWIPRITGSKTRAE